MEGSISKVATAYEIKVTFEGLTDEVYCLDCGRVAWCKGEHKFQELLEECLSWGTVEIIRHTQHGFTIKGPDLD